MLRSHRAGSGEIPGRIAFRDDDRARGDAARFDPTGTDNAETNAVRGTMECLQQRSS